MKTPYRCGVCGEAGVAPRVGEVRRTLARHIQEAHPEVWANILVQRDEIEALKARAREIVKDVRARTNYPMTVGF